MRIHALGRAVPARAVCLLAAVLGLSTHARAYVHPGAPLTLSDLQTLKTNVDQGRQPWKSAYDLLAADGLSQATYVMRGPQPRVSRQGDYDQYLWAWRTDMVAIWNQARMWHFTGNPAYAQKAHDILLAWANTQVEFSGRESMLDLGDYAYAFVGGADILRGTWPGWTEADTTAVKAYFNNVLLPASNPYGESQFGAANKGALALVAMGLMSIFNDDTARLDDVVYKVRTLAHIGLRSSNDLGMLGDSLRDQGHAHGQLVSLAMLAEALWKQGIDVYSDFDNRLLAAGEYFARVNELATTPFLPFGTTDAYYTADNTNHGWGGGNVALGLIHGAYVVRKGLQAPYIAQRRQEMPVDGSSFMFFKEVDTSVASPAPALSFPPTSSVTAGFQNIEIGGATPAGGAAYSGGVWTVQGGGAEIWSSNDSCHFTYQALTGDCSVVAKVESVQNTNLSAKAGVMMRTSLSQGAPRAWMAVTNRVQAEQNMPGLAVYGGTNYGNKALNIASSSASYWVKLERIGNIITGYLSPDGTNWAATDLGRIDAPVPSTIYVGLVVCSVANGTLNTSTFSNVRITGGDGGAPVIAPAAPAALLASPGDGVVPLRWQSSFGAASYTVKRATTSGGPYSTIASGITAASYTDTTVTNGTTYYYVVTATNSAGTSVNSSEDGATPSRPLVNVAIGGTPNDSANNPANAGNAFDRNPATQWFYSGSGGRLQYDLGLGYAQVVTRYTVTSSSDQVPRDPKDWQFQGSNDGSAWTTLDTQSNQTFANRYQMNGYPVASPASYRFYRLNITANNGDASFTDLSELGLWAADRVLPNGVYLSAVPGDGQVALAWLSSATSTYTVKRSATSGGPYSTVATGLTGTTYTDTGLANNVASYYVVSAANGSNSAELSASPGSRRVQLAFDENGGFFAADSSGFARDATLVNGPTFSAGATGNAINLAATSSQYAKLPSGVMGGLGDFTISTWVKVNSFATWQRIFDFGTGTTNYMFLTTQYTATAPNNAKLRFGIRTPSVGEQSVSGNGIALATGVWTHVAVTRSGNAVSLYVNGALAGSGNVTLSPADLGVTTQNYLGKSQFNDPYLNGALDDFRIYGQAMNAAEVAGLASGTFPAPQNLVVSAGDTQASLAWQSVAAARSYIVKRSVASVGPYAVVGTTVSTSYADTGLARGATYYYVVSASNTAGESANSSEVSAITIPPSPAGLTLTPGNGQVGLSWSAASGASGYTILRATSPNGTYATVATGVTGTSYTDTGLSNGTTYYYAVVASNGSGSSANSTQVDAITAPAAPAGLASSGSGTQIGLVWGASTGASTYNVKRSITPGGPYSTVASGVSATNYTDTGLVAGGTYYYVVTAANTTGESPASAETSATLAPAAPAGLSANGWNGAVDLAWSASGGATSYTVKRAATGGGAYATLASGVAFTSYSDTSAVNGTTYTYVVSASNAGGESANSAEASTTFTQPLVYLKFDETSGASAADSSGNGWTGTLVNGPLWSAGRSGNSVDLDGVNDHVTLPAGVVAGLNNFTITLWANLDSLSTWSRLFDFGTGTTVNMFLTPKNGANSKLRFAITTGGGNAEQRIDGAAALPIGGWHHVAVTLNGSTGTLYVDGVQVGQNTAMTLKPSSLGSTTQNRIGRSQYNDPYLMGRVDEFRVYGRALSAAEVASLMNTSPLGLVSAPATLAATPGAGQIVLNWSAVSGATSYDVLRATTSVGPFLDVATGLTTTTYANTGLTAGTTYTYVIVARTATSESANSPVASAAAQ